VKDYALPLDRYDLPSKPPPPVRPSETLPLTDGKVDIDAVLAELDALSGRLLKPPSKKGPATEPETKEDSGQ
jgi:hypothetical protein